MSLELEQTTMVDVLSLRVLVCTGTNYPPIYIKQAASVEMYKKELKTFLFDNDIDFLN